MTSEKIDQLLSTTAAARKHNISSKYLFTHLVKIQYLVKENKRYTLTEKGLRAGGCYRHFELGKKAPVWPDKTISQIVKMTNWPVDVKKKFSSTQKKYYKRLPSGDTEKKLIHGQLDNGTKILSTEEELDVYLWAYGGMHKAKLDKAFTELHVSENLSRVIDGRDIEVIDYACGQGIATIVFIEFLKNKGIPHSIARSILIEPSELALDRAKSLLTGNIVPINKKLDDLVGNDLLTDDTLVKFHLLSNILDMGINHFDLKNLSKAIINSQNGINYFVCVSPYAEGKLESFADSFVNRHNIFSCSGTLTNTSGRPGACPWKFVIRVFRVTL